VGGGLYPSARVSMVLTMGGQAVRKPFERFPQKKFESPSSYLLAFLQSCNPCQTSDVANLQGVRYKARKGAYPPPSFLLGRVPHPDCEQGEGAPLLWRDRGPLDPWEVVAKVGFLELWRETVAGCLNGPSPSSAAVPAANSFRAGLLRGHS